MWRPIKWLLVLVLLAALAPLASRRPDPVRHLLKLPGGASDIPKAAAGILLAGAAVYFLLRLILLFRGPRPKT